MIRFVSFIALAMSALFFPWWVFACASLVYVLIFTSYELLALAVCIDAIFGDPNVGMWYVYTLTVSLLLVASSFVKPYLRMYT